MPTMTEQTPAQAPPGWYPVPGGTQWWDGTAWTGQVQPAQLPQPRQPSPPATVSYVPVQTNHTFHLIMTLITFGLWGVFVWLPMTVLNQLRKHKVATRPY